MPGNTRAPAVVVLGLLLAFALGACGESERKSSFTSTAAAISPQGKQIGKLSTPGTPQGEQTVHLVVLAKKGAERAAFALVPVYIDGKGPFPFAVDTGASSSLLGQQLARQLKLPRSGAAKPVSGVTGSGEAFAVRVDNWRVGGVQLPPSLIDALEQQGGEEEEHVTPERGISGAKGPMGLLGSDVLSRYGKIAIDYDRGLLVLDPPVK
jgi:hypothetical protein